MKNNKKGFTLAELLIVIAIMAILIAIAIPVFSSQLERARHAVDAQMERAAKSIAESHYLLEHTSNSPSELTLKFSKDGEDNLVLAQCSGGYATAAGETGKCSVPASATIADANKVMSQCTDDTASGATDGGEGSGKELTVTVKSDGTVAGDWS